MRFPSQALCAVGFLARHRRLKAGDIGIPSSILEIAADRSWLETRSRFYALSDEEAELSDDIRSGAISLLHEAHGALPAGLEWLRPDFSVYAAWTGSEMAELCRKEAADREALFAALRKKLNGGD